MESVNNNVEMDYPDQILLVKHWREHASAWVMSAWDDFESNKLQEAFDVLSPERINEVLNETNSRQKIFDVYGVAATLKSLLLYQRAKEVLLELIKLVPYATLDVDISSLCYNMEQLTERLKFMEYAYEKWPENPVIWNYLGTAMMSLNQKEEGIEFLRRSAAALPTNDMMNSNLLFFSHHLEEINCKELFCYHKRWARYNAFKDYVITDHKNDPNPDRKIRIGYISPDLNMHPVGFLIKPIIDFHDRSEVEIFGYGYPKVQDILTERIKESLDHYRDIRNVDDREAVRMIVEDKIDILIDLAGHTGGGRLGILSKKPAPVQVTYLGYFDTTGLDQIDYFLTDKQMSPPETQQYHTEELFCLPNTCFCYKLPDDAVDVVASPYLKNGYITFGMYSNPSKITNKVSRLWARILANTENSRLKMIIKDGDNKDTVATFMKVFDDAGISRDRVDISGKIQYGKYFAEYGTVDIMLDTYPYNGGATTCDALWMGVPVISLVGEHHFSRVGLSLLTSVGLDYFACKTEDEYVAKASVLAAKPESLAKIRGTLRQRMQASAMCDMKLQTKGIEDAYREMWRRWCEKQTNNA